MRLPLRRRWALAAAVVAVAIFVLSSIPAPTLARTGLQIWDKAAHAGAWALLAFCIGRALRVDGVGLARAALAIAIAVAYGGLDELHQRFTPGREVSGWDIVADAIGSLIGVAIANAYGRRRP